jgi:hypothetical protein
VDVSGVVARILPSHSEHKPTPATPEGTPDRCSLAPCMIEI